MRCSCFFYPVARGGGISYNIMERRRMKSIGRKTKQNRWRLRPVDGYLVFWFALNLLFLTRFPSMHSDESWLSGLSRSMMTGGLGAQEYFFDLLPRYPHAIKTVYHVLQMLFTSMFGYGLFAVRLLSLVFGVLSLYAFYGLAKTYFNSTFSLLAVMALSLNIQFIYGAHFARQEIVILTELIFCLYYFSKHRENWGIKKDVLMGALVGLSVGIHPSSFIAALTAGAVYLYDLLFCRNIKVKNLLVLVGVTALFAGAFVALSYRFTPHFISNYLTYGDDLGTTRTFAAKVFEFPKFYQRLYFSTGITYYLPNIRIYFWLFGIGVLGALAFCFTKQRDRFALPLAAFAAINIGYLLIGRYAQPTILFVFPFALLLVLLLMDRVKRIRGWLTGGLLALTLASSLFGFVPKISNDYDAYMAQIKSMVPADAEVLANLNAEYAFDNGRLHDYRNLAYLDENGMTFGDYIEAYDIEYIIYPEEMDFVYENRPVWNVLYGNLYPYYDGMKDFLGNRCEYLGAFHSPYAMRIVDYSHDKPWEVRVYRVKDCE